MRKTVSVVAACFVAACGSGGGDSPPPSSASPPPPPPPPTTSAPPTVSAPALITADPNEVISIVANVDDDLGVESILWEQTEGGAVSVSGESTSTLNFTAPELTLGETISFRVTVSDAQSQTASTTTNVTINPVVDNLETITLDIPAVDGLDFDSEEDPLIVVSGRRIAVVSSPGSISLNVPMQEPIGLASANGTPILMNLLGASGADVELTTSTSAEGFVLRSPRFFGTEILDRAELSRRIRAADSFSELVAVIERQIRLENPCPMDQACNPTAARIAEGIAQSLDLEDLLAEGN